MAKAYSEEIVYTDTEDGLVLEGVVIRPTTASPRPFAVVWVHGLTGRFYEKSTILICRDLASEGYTVVSGNNRGHHFGARIPARRAAPVLAAAAGSVSTSRRTTSAPGSRSPPRWASSGSS